jgi:class 3 adenylate cyclase
MGVALHHGEAAYSNVGSGVRLDFTVIGPDVNLASRIAQLNKVLGEPLLMSQAFVDVLPGRSEPLGGLMRWMGSRRRCRSTALPAPERLGCSGTPARSALGREPVPYRPF